MFGLKNVNKSREIILKMNLCQLCGSVEDVSILEMEFIPILDRLISKVFTLVISKLHKLIIFILILILILDQL